MRRSVVLAVAAVTIAVAGGLASIWVWPFGGASADGEASAETLALGEAIYAESCASCHGANLEGEPDWRARLPSGLLPAPPHDASGHTWHHPDDMLFRITKEGPAAVIGDGYESAMPGFGEVLSDEEIRAVLAFIKSTWPERERAYQAEMTRRSDER